MANVLVAFLSFFADDFSRFLRDALFMRYMVNRDAAVARRSFFDPPPPGVLPAFTLPLFASVLPSAAFDTDVTVLKQNK